MRKSLSENTNPMHPRTIVIMGRPGSGKGTQAQLLAKKINAREVSLGTQFRALVAGNTYLGQRLKVGFEAGELAPTWIADYLCEKELLFLEQTETVVFDSGCRIRSEAILFNDIHEWLKRDYVVVYIEVSESEIRSRIIKRQGIEGRADDAQNAIVKRIQEFDEKTTQSIDYFKSIGKLLVVQGEQSVEDVQREVLKVLKIA